MRISRLAIAMAWMITGIAYAAVTIYVDNDADNASFVCGSEIPTPHLDALAKNGLRFTGFHSNGSVCSPTRCALMTGCYQNRAGIVGLVRGSNGMSPDDFSKVGSTRKECQ